MTTQTERPGTLRGGADQRTLCRIYLNDHRAGAAGATAVLGRMIESNAGTPLAETLTGILHEIEEDVDALEAVMRHVGAASNPVKNLGAKLGERIGRLKPNGRIRGYSPLSRVLELEGLMAGIDMKRRLWESLHVAAGSDRVGDVDLTRYMRRADTQRDRLRSHHEEAAAVAFGHIER